MRTETPQPVRLAEYRPPAYLIDEVFLDFALEPSATRVKAKLTVRRNGDHAGPLVLDGDGLKTLWVKVDGVDHVHEATAETLTLADLPDAFVLETEVQIDPAANTALMGLYMSGGRFCTQCEAEGFRRITYFLDRPDVMALFSVTLRADKARYPVLLSNGNLVAQGELPDNRHFAQWVDPHKKPCYLFALVAGKLVAREQKIKSRSGTDHLLQV